MRATTKWMSSGIIAAAILLAGCVRHEYFALQNGYGYRMAVSGIPDSGAHVVYTYTPTDGSRRILWPSLFSGYYGEHIIQDDLILFGVDLQAAGASHISSLLAAKDGPPAVDITKAIVRAAQKGGQDARALDFGYCTFERTDSGVTVQCRRWIDEQKRFEPVEIVFTWQEIADLVVRSPIPDGPAHRVDAR